MWMGWDWLVGTGDFDGECWSSVIQDIKLLICVGEAGDGEQQQHFNAQGVKRDPIITFSGRGQPTKRQKTKCWARSYCRSQQYLGEANQTTKHRKNCQATKIVMNPGSQLSVL
jgi:hypothetical protein